MKYLKYWRDRLASSETLVVGGTAMLVGAGSAGGIWLFKWLIFQTQLLSFGKLVAALPPLGGWSVVLIPVLGGLVVGLLLHFFLGHERYEGVAGIMESVALAGGRLRYRRAPVKAVTAAISIGTGASVGPEDPSVQIGSNLGSWIGQKLHFSDERMRILVAAGAASGIAAAFNAPIAGIFFALEIILGEISGSALGVVVIAAVTSAVTTQAVAGAEPAFHVPSYSSGPPWLLIFYLGLGLLAGPVSALYIRLLFAARDLFQSWTWMPRWLKPAVAGLGVGLVGHFLPQVFGVGYETIGKILVGETIGLSLLFGLMIAKLILTPLSIAGGFPGGVFAPALFIGATLGGVYGELVQRLFSQPGIVPAGFAMVGMAAVLAGAVHAPLTAIMLLFEMTRDYRIILPLMFAVIVSMILSQRLVRESVYTMGLVRKGIRLERGRDVDVLETITVGELMQLDPCLLATSYTLQEASETLIQTRHHGAPVIDENGYLAGILTLQDLDRNETQTWATRTVGETCTRNLLTAFPDETMGTALHRMSTRDIGRLPVVRRDQPQKLVGLLRRSDVVHAYDAALTQRARLRHTIQQSRLDALTPEKVQIVEIRIQVGSFCDGRKIKEVPWPVNGIVASLRRGRQVLIPHGETVLAAGDMLAYVTDEAALDAVQRLTETASPSQEMT